MKKMGMRAKSMTRMTRTTKTGGVPRQMNSISGELANLQLNILHGTTAGEGKSNVRDLHLSAFEL